MRKKLLREAATYIKLHKRHRLRNKVVRFLACIVVFCTTYALILPALTMETPCPLEEHIHSESCYRKITTQEVMALSCSYETLNVHSHSEDCYNEEGLLICEQADFLVHTHSDACYDSSDNLLCKLPEIKAHEHTDSCYKVAEPAPTEPAPTEPAPAEDAAPAEAPHVHDSTCYTVTRGELICQMPEIAEEESHKHTESCYSQGDLLCEIPESEEHYHSAECYASILDCGLEESEPHQHSDACYKVIETLICQLSEENNSETPPLSAEPGSSESLTETVTPALTEETPAEPELICTEPVVLSHTHEESCYKTVEVPLENTEQLTCTILESHTHAESCYDALGELTCTIPEGHIHGNMCYGTWEKICTLEEHAHDAVCTALLGLDEADRTKVEVVIDLIDLLPTYDEHLATMEAFYKSGDIDGEKAYNEALYEKTSAAYRAYMALSEELQEYVTNLDKLTDLEFIWSRITIEETYNYSPLPYAAENTRVYLFDYGPLINTKVTGQGMGYLPFYRLFPEYSYTVDGASRLDYDRTVNGNTVKSDAAAPILKNTLQQNNGTNKFPHIADGITGYLSDTTANGSWLTQNGSLQYLFDPNYSGHISKNAWKTNIRAASRSTFSYNPYANIGLTNINQKPAEDSNAGASNSAYLFRSAYLPVTNNGTGTGLFQKDADGYFYYDSGKNAAWYNPDKQKFELYNYTLLPGHKAFENYGGSTNGNFLPFNKGHVEGRTDYQTKEGYVQNKNGNVRWDQRVTANVGDTVDGYPLLKENFRLITSNRTNSVNLNFGMVVEFDFYMPKDGMIDGKAMEFIFKGDDDVWVFIDDVLILDIGGCHGAQDARINFATGALTQPTGAGYHKPTSLKNAFSNTGADTSTFSGNTFGDYTAHTLKFYYMERGGNTSFCRIKFNMPQIPDEAISVKKELSSSVTTLGNPDYYFNLMALDSDGQTRRLFVGRTDSHSVIPKNKYKIKNSDGTYLKNTDGTEYFSTDSYGIFKLKAGQTAIFDDIPATTNKFYVQELMKEADRKQYLLGSESAGYTSQIKVNSKDPVWQGLVTWNGRGYFDAFNAARPEIGPYNTVWYAASGPITDASVSKNALFYFNYQNVVQTSGLSSLSITKALTAAEGGLTNGTYKINVALDGEPLPSGTTYKVGSATRTVGFDASGNSYVELANGETATISNILAGSQFHVWESAASAKGHSVSYQVTNNKNGICEYSSDLNNGVTGTIHAGGQISLLVTNTQHGAKVDIPVSKSFHSFTGGPYSYTFTLTELTPDGNGGWTAGNTLATKNVSFSSAAAKSFTLVTIPYLKQDFDSFPVVKYYLVEETGETAPTMDNTTQHLVEVTISETAAKAATSPIKAEITKILRRNSPQEAWPNTGVSSIAFTNTLAAGDLKVTKTLVSSGADLLEKEFSFTLTVSAGTSGMMPGSFQAVKTDQNGATTTETVTSASYQFALKHNESIVFTGLPLGTAWSVRETNADGFIPSWKVGNTSGHTFDTGGTLTLADTTVAYTNTASYELPNTGGAGTNLYTLGGFALILISAACLVYSKKRRRGDA